MFVIAIYIARDADGNDTLRELHNNISSFQNKHQEAFYVVAGDPHSMWNGIKCIMDYDTRDTQCPRDPSLPEALNRFKDPNMPPPSTRLSPPPGEETLKVSTAKMRRTLKIINPCKAAGPDNIPGLRNCTDQLSKVLADIFNSSLIQAAVPTCMKTATIIPVPKGSAVTGLNDYRPVALTSIITKCLERLIMAHIKATINVTKDLHQYAVGLSSSLQYAYQFTEDAICSVVHTTVTHLEPKDSYIRMLLVDFTSAFDNMIRQTLINKLLTVGLSSSLCKWALDFLTSGPQSVRIQNVSLSPIVLSTGSPQGCVLSPLLFMLLTYVCSPNFPGCHIINLQRTQRWLDRCPDAVEACMTWELSPHLIL